VLNLFEKHAQIIIGLTRKIMLYSTLQHFFARLPENITLEIKIQTIAVSILTFFICRVN